MKYRSESTNKNPRNAPSGHSPLRKSPVGDVISCVDVAEIEDLGRRCEEVFLAVGYNTEEERDRSGELSLTSGRERLSLTGRSTTR